MGFLISLVILALVCLQISTAVQISKCQEIINSGTYVLAADLYGLQDGRDYCIGIFASNVVLDGNGYSITGNGFEDGIFIAANANNITLKNLNVSGYKCGILSYSNSNVITNSKVSHSIWHGIYLSGSNNIIASSSISHNTEDGIFLVDSSNSIITNSIISNNNGNGIYLENSNNNVIANCSILSNNKGYGIYLWFSSDNKIYNNYFNNTANANAIPIAVANSWNIAKTSGKNIVGGNYICGNYWGKPDGTGFSDTCVDSDKDGICDNPFRINENNVDLLPLAKLSAPAPTPTPKPTPGFEAIFAIAGLLAVAYLLRRKS